MPDGFALDEAAMQQVINGHQSAVDTLAGLVPGGKYVAESGSAQGLLSMLGSLDDLGEDQGLRDALTEFAGEATQSLGSLLRTGEGIAKQLEDVIASYRGQDDQVSDLFKEIFVTVVSPDAQAAEHAGDQSWEQILTEEGSPDWTEGWGQVDDSIGQAAGSVWNDATSTPGRVWDLAKAPFEGGDQ